MSELLSREQVQQHVDELSRWLTYPALDALHALNDADATLRQQLTDCHAHLEAQRTETYQAVKRHQEALREIQRLKEGKP